MQLGVQGIAACVIKVDAPRIVRRIGCELDVPADFPGHASLASRPLFVVDGEPFWGSERMALLAQA